MTALLWTPEAIDDREQIYSYIEADKPLAALALDELFDEQAALLIAHPYIGKPGRVAGTRELVVHKSYLLVYDLHEGALRILRLLHVARQWPPA